MSKKGLMKPYKKYELQKLSRNHLVNIVLRQEKAIKQLTRKIFALNEELMWQEVEELNLSHPNVISVEEFLKLSNA